MDHVRLDLCHPCQECLPMLNTHLLLHKQLYIDNLNTLCDLVVSLFRVYRLISDVVVAMLIRERAIVA